MLEGSESDSLSSSIQSLSYDSYTSESEIFTLRKEESAQEVTQVLRVEIMRKAFTSVFKSGKDTDVKNRERSRSPEESKRLNIFHKKSLSPTDCSDSSSKDQPKKERKGSTPSLIIKKFENLSKNFKSSNDKKNISSSCEREHILSEAKKEEQFKSFSSVNLSPVASPSLETSPLKSGFSVSSSVLSSRPPLPSPQSSDLHKMKSCSPSVLSSIDRFSTCRSPSPSASDRRTRFSQTFSSESTEGSSTKITTQEITIPIGSIKNMSAFLKSSTSVEQLEEEGTTSYIVTTSDGDESGGDENENKCIVVSRKISQPTTTYDSARSSSMSQMAGSNGYKAMKSELNDSSVARMTSSGMEVEEALSVSARKAALESEGFSAMKSSDAKDHRKVMRTGDTTRQQMSNVKNASSRMVSNEGFAEKRIRESAKEDSLVSSSGSRYHAEKNMTASSSSKFMSADGTKTSMMTSSSSNVTSYSSISGVGSMTDLFNESFDGTPLAITSLHSPSNMLSLAVASSLNIPGKNSSKNNRDSLMIEDITSEVKTLDAEYLKAEKKLVELVEKLKKAQNAKEDQLSILPQIRDILRKSWFILGCDLSSKLCAKLQSNGGLELLVNRCKSDDDLELQASSAQVLQYALSTENVTHVLAAKDSDKFVEFVTSHLQKPKSETSKIRAAIGILTSLFMSNEETCKELCKRGALDMVLLCCRSTDLETQRNCAFAMANLALFGGSEVHNMMMNKKVPEWLLVLIFSSDDFVRYNACHAISVLVSNKEIEALVHKATNLMLVEQFLHQHSSTEMALNPLSRYYGQSKEWLRRYSAILDSDREEAKSLASFHFAITANIRKRQGTLVDLTKEIKTLIDLLNKAASSPNAIASKYAAQALKLIGAEIPHKLSQQVPNWTVDDVKEWIKQIGFNSFLNNFVNSKVDGDLLLQLDDNMLKDDIGIGNGILRKRFARELAHLKIITDYSSCDTSSLTDLLENLGEAYLQYTYNMVNAGIDSQTLQDITEEQLENECRIANSIHRRKIVTAAQKMRENDPSSCQSDSEKSLDVFVSYRRSNGSQLASLLKVLLQMRGFSTFIDIERLEAGKFDCNLISSIRQAKHFILVLTPNALDRCIGDTECKDWVHREIVEALKSNCNIIPVVENFDWPKTEDLPEDIRAISRFNAIRWIHEYQDACVDKLDRFMKGILASSELEQHNKGTNVSTPVTSTPGTPSVYPKNLSSTRK